MSRRRGPAGEQVKRLPRAAIRLRAVDAHRQAVICGKLHDLIGKVELADDRMVKALLAGVMEAAEELLRAVPGIEIVKLDVPAVGLQSVNL